jgi:hypothetical protein
MPPPVSATPWNHPIAALLGRGREALLAHLERSYSAEDRPFGASDMSCVTEEDFIANVRCCLDYAQKVRTLHLLTANGEIATLVMAANRPRVPTPKPKPPKVA